MVWRINSRFFCVCFNNNNDDDYNVDGDDNNNDDDGKLREKPF